MVVQQVARFGNGFEAGLGAEFANAVSGVIVGNGAVVHTREQMMPEVVQLVFRMGAPVAKEHTIGDWEPKVMGKQPAIFFCVDHEFWLVRDALGSRLPRQNKKPIGSVPAVTRSDVLMVGL